MVDAIEDVLKTIEDTNVRTAVSEVIKSIASTHEDNIKTLDSKHDTSLSDLNKKVKDLEFTAAGDDNGIGGGNPELTAAQKSLQDKWNQDDADAKTKFDLDQTAAKLVDQEATILNYMKDEAKRDGIPDSILELSDSSAKLTELSTIYKAGRGDSSDSRSSNTISSGTIGTQGNEQKSNKYTNDPLVEAQQEMSVMIKRSGLQVDE